MDMNLVCPKCDKIFTHDFVDEWDMPSCPDCYYMNRVDEFDTLDDTTVQMLDIHKGVSIPIISPKPKWKYHSESIGGNISFAVDYINEYHSDWDVVSISGDGFNTIVVWREEVE